MPPAARPLAQLFVLVGPSCSGKSELAERLMARFPEIRRVVTTTTRPPGPGEVQGRDYWYLSRREFQRELATDAFLETTEVSGHRYGMSRAAIETVRRQGGVPFAILDARGLDAVRESVPVVAVFLRSPVADLERRIREHRGGRDVERLVAALPEELAGAERCDVVLDIPEDGLDAAAARLADLYVQQLRPRLLGRIPARRGRGAPVGGG